MYRGSAFSARKILIVKTSSLGDVIQSFTVLQELKQRFPFAEVDWVVEERFASLVKAHPLIHRTIVFNSRVRSFRSYFKAALELRKARYDYVFDLQGNCKSGLVTLLSKGKCKVGFGRKSVREWPNLLATHRHFNVPTHINIRLQLLGLIQSAFNEPIGKVPKIEGISFWIDAAEEEKVAMLLRKREASSEIKIMVCPGSVWRNKRLDLDTWILFLEKIDQSMKASFFLIWGNEEEREVGEAIRRRFPSNSLLIDKLTLPVWHHLMGKMSVIIAVDSAALHLAATTSVPSFSIFGPTMPEVFQPLGEHHASIRGSCPYQKRFEKQCPLLRSCSSGACIRGLSAEAIFNRFISMPIGGQNRCGSPPDGSPAGL